MKLHSASFSFAVASKSWCFVCARTVARSAESAGVPWPLCNDFTEETGKPTAAASDDCGSHFSRLFSFSASCEDGKHQCIHHVLSGTLRGNRAVNHHV